MLFDFQILSDYSRYVIDHKAIFYLLSYVDYAALLQRLVVLEITLSNKFSKN